jgi:hypothetical protein
MAILSESIKLCKYILKDFCQVYFSNDMEKGTSNELQQNLVFLVLYYYNVLRTEVVGFP